jgi:hypothetical protein
MNSRLIRRIGCCVLHAVLAMLVLMGAIPIAIAGTITLDFEGFPDSTVLTTQYPGVTFTNTIILTSGISLNEFEFPPHSGVNVASDNDGPITIDFASPITSFSGYFTYIEPLTLAGFDATDTLVATAASEYSDNDALFGDPSSSPNEFIQLTYAGGVSSVTITGDLDGGSFVMDDVTYTTGGTTIPEPSSYFLVLLASAFIAGGLRTRTFFFKKHENASITGIRHNICRRVRIGGDHLANILNFSKKLLRG